VNDATSTQRFLITSKEKKNKRNQASQKKTCRERNLNTIGRFSFCMIIDEFELIAQE
jgi:hypothetical protein